MGELINLRSRYSKHYPSELSEGGIRAEISIAPIHYEVVSKFPLSSPWDDIDLTLLPCNLWEFEWYCYKNSFTAYFNDSTDINNTLASFEVKNANKTSRWINYKLVGANHCQVEIDANKIKYLGAYDGIDIQYIVTETEMKENIYIRDIASYRDIEFSLKLDGETDFHIDDVGNIVFIDLLTGEELYKIKFPFAYDSQIDEYGEPTNFGNTMYTINETIIDNITYKTVKVVVDSNWLRTAQFPIIIDPTTAIQPSDTTGIDAYILEYSPTSATGATTNYMDVGNRSGGDSWSLINFPLPSDFMGSIVNSASMYLRVNADYINDTSGTTHFQINVITSSWDEATVNWNTRPTTGTTLYDVAHGGYWSSAADRNFNLTTAYQNIANGTQANYGFRMWITNSVSWLSSNQYMRFYGSNNATSAYRPKLTLDYIPQATGVSGTPFGNINKLGRRLIA